MLSYSLSALVVFSKVVKYKSFSKAASVLYMTQPGASNSVAQLEAQTGLKLMKRGNGGLQLTEEGKILYRYAQRVERAAWELEDALRSLRKEATPYLRIGTTINYARRVMPALLGEFQKAHPEIKIRLDAGSSIEMEESLLSRKNDVVIVANLHRSNKIQSYPFVREELMFVVSKDHPLAGNKQVSLKDIHSYPFIIREEGSATRGAVLAAFASMNIAPSVLIEVNSTEFIKEWVSQGKGVSIIIRRAVNGEEDGSLAPISLAEPLYLEVFVHYLKSKRHDPSVQKFIGYLNEMRLNQQREATEG